MLQNSAPRQSPSLQSPSKPFWTAALQAREIYLMGAVLALVLVVCFAPALPATDWHIVHFADTRAFMGLPNADDVLSNIPFLLMGIWGFVRLARTPDAPMGTSVFFAGLIITFSGSSLYHLNPDAISGLVADRLGMTVAFAGFLGLAASERISPRAGKVIVVLMMVAGVLAAYVARDNVTPWAVVQFGGMALGVGLTLTRPLPSALGVPLGGIVFFYALAKVFELGDAAIFEATQHVISGHTLKHLAAALAAWPVISALGRIRTTCGRCRARSGVTGSA